MRKFTPRQKARRKAYQKQWHILNRDYVNTMRRGDYGATYNLSSRFGVTPAKAKELVAERKKGCVICLALDRPSGKHCGVDHSHITGEVRSILCSFHNALVGYLEKVSSDEMEIAHAYLESYR